MSEIQINLLKEAYDSWRKTILDLLDDLKLWVQVTTVDGSVLSKKFVLGKDLSVVGLDPRKSVVRISPLVYFEPRQANGREFILNIRIENPYLFKEAEQSTIFIASGSKDLYLMGTFFIFTSSIGLSVFLALGLVVGLVVGIKTMTEKTPH